MKKLLLLSVFIALVGFIFAAEPFDATTIVVGNASAVTGTWTDFVVDTFTLKPANGLKKITFARPLYNVNVTVLNAAGDSGYINIYTETGFFSAYNSSDAVARGLAATDVWRADTARYYMGIHELYVLAKKGGTADSAAVIKLWGVR